MDDRQQEESAMTRYRVGVGEEFPMAERLRREFERGCRYGEARWREESGYWRRRFGGGSALWGLAALVAVVAALSVAISYPLATLGVLAAVLLLSRGRRGRRRHRKVYDA
ncbi:MAG: hypothetical protein CVT72_02245 [Alphaproteobacteria bacterium HGW-Alphaproteobacteria-11]|nr:MAG: hypothetical protein CVT72_02245 [Alphaproteobacteria bacterium HGW-Alphaproteobacteria-11]